MTRNADLDTSRDRKFTISDDNLAIRTKLSVIRSDLSFEFVAQLPDDCFFIFPY